MKVLHIINSLTIGGAEILLTNSLAKGGLQDHVENIILYFQGESELVDKIDKRVTVINLAYKGWHSFGSLLIRIRETIKIHKPDIIHTHLNPAGWYTALGRPKNIPQIHTLHISYSDNTDTDKVRLFFEKKLLLQRKDANLITLSDLLKEDLKDSVNIKGNVFVLSNFIADEFFEPNPVTPPSAIFKLVAVGNMRPQKNYNYLLDIFQHLKNYPVSVDVYGYGDHTMYSQRAAKENLPVKFMGPVKNPKDIYWKYNGFIMPSKFEGFGLTAYEAMASELPVFLSDIGAFKSLIKDNAVYFSLTDAANAAEIIKTAINNTGNIEEMITKAKQYAQKTVKREMYITNLLKIYEQVLVKKVVNPY